MKRVYILMIVAVAVIALLVTGVLLTREQPTGTPPPTLPSQSASEIVIEPTETQSATPSVAPSPTGEPLPDVPVMALPEGEDLTPDAQAMTDAAVDYLRSALTMDYSTYPGYDFKRMMELSLGPELIRLDALAPGLREPRAVDKEMNEDFNKMAPGGVYKQSVKFNEAWVTESTNYVVVDVDTDNNLDYEEMVETSWYFTMHRCDRNDHGWCVYEVRDYSLDG